MLGKSWFRARIREKNKIERSSVESYYANSISAKDDD